MASTGNTTGNKRLDWVINTTSSTSKSIYRLQSYNAFGEVVQETDGNGNTIDMTYNTLGKLTKKQDPIANFTRANRFIETTLRPNTDYTYDAAGRMVAMQDANGNLNTQA